MEGKEACCFDVDTATPYSPSGGLRFAAAETAVVVAAAFVALLPTLRFLTYLKAKMEFTGCSFVVTRSFAEFRGIEIQRPRRNGTRCGGLSGKSGRDCLRLPEAEIKHAARSKMELKATEWSPRRAIRYYPFCVPFVGLVGIGQGGIFDRGVVVTSGVRSMKYLSTNSRREDFNFEGFVVILLHICINVLLILHYN